MPKYIGNRCVPRHAGVWDKQKEYEMLEIVLSENGDSYTSRKAVPVGIELSNTEYWALSAKFSAQLDKFENEFMSEDEFEQMWTDIVKGAA